MSDERDTPAGPRPFLKWAGGKTQLLPELLKRVPPVFGTYYEPFLGGGTLFWRLRPESAVLGDLNRELCRAYQGVQREVDLVARELEVLFSSHGPEQYAAMRALDLRGMPLASSAARTIYLNKTCFNGLYRVNRAGRFNVPIGRSKSPPHCDVGNLSACSAALNARSGRRLAVAVRAADYRELLAGAVAGDFAYLDPPYVPSSKTSYFTAFTKESFGKADQSALADLVVELRGRGVHVLLSNSDTSEAVALYESRGLRVEHVRGRRSISCGASGRGAVGEILVTCGGTPGGSRG
jgi:DNA adenine methylase